MADKEAEKQPAEEKPKAEKKSEEAPKPEKPQAKKEAPAESKEPAAKAESESKRKKISRMKLEEVEAEIKIMKEKMGGFQSGFAHHLLARRKELAGSSK